MSRVPAFESPIVRPGPQLSGGLALTDESALTKLIVRCGDETPAAAFLDVRHGSSRPHGDVLIVGQRPTEWLVVGSRESVDLVAERIDQTGHVSCIDHTHSRAMLRLTGDYAVAALAKICDADMGDSITPNGAALTASIAMVNCDIVRVDLGNTRSYRLACDRSSAQYLYDAILDACDEFSPAARSTDRQ